MILSQVPATSVGGVYKLRVEGLYDGIIGGYAFNNETRLTFSQRSMTIFIQTDKPIYKQSDIGMLTLYIITDFTYLSMHLKKKNCFSLFSSYSN